MRVGIDMDAAALCAGRTGEAPVATWFVGVTGEVQL